MQRDVGGFDGRRRRLGRLHELFGLDHRAFALQGARRLEIEGLAGEPVPYLAHGMVLALAQRDGPPVEIEVEPRVVRGIEERLEGSEDERRVRGRDELHLGAVLAREGVHHLEQRRDDAALPLRVEVALDFVDEEDDLARRGVAPQLGALDVLLPRPGEQVRERDDAPHARRGVEIGRAHV